MENASNSQNPRVSFLTTCNDFYELCKPRVVMMLVFTAVIGMFLATPGMVPWQPLVFGTLGIGLAASSAAAINQVVDQKIDKAMHRTEKRPLPKGNITNFQAMVFAVTLGVIAMAILTFLVNGLTAWLTFLSLIGYAVIYTMFLKHATPQNIVIGGAAGAAPPVLGWTAVTGAIDPSSLWLFLIIFTWTPPHFWALAIHRRDEYAKADVPMLPVTHGVEYTRRQVLLYTIIMCAVTLMPFATRMSGVVYLAGVIILNTIFLYYVIKMQSGKDPSIPMKTFGYSIVYLMLLFALLLIDHYLPQTF